MQVFEKPLDDIISGTEYVYKRYVIPLSISTLFAGSAGVAFDFANETYQMFAPAKVMNVHQNGHTAQPGISVPDSITTKVVPHP